MKGFALFVLFGLALAPAFTQTNKPKTTSTAKALKKPTPKTTAAKAKPSPKKTQTAGKTTTKLKKPAPVAKATPKPKANESAEWEKVTAIEDLSTRIDALKKFVATFPDGKHIADASTKLATDEIAMGDANVASGDTKTAIGLYLAAAQDVQKPIPADLFTEKFAKLPTTLFFKGENDAALQLAHAIEARAGNEQLLTIAAFYLTLENGDEARRVAQAVIAATPTAPAYQMLGLAERVNFQLEDSAAAFAKAVEIDPNSLAARRGLAEAKRALGKSDEAAALYGEIIEKEPDNLSARTGLTLSLFDSGKRAEAETAMAASLEKDPGNVTLLAGAAYWYAAHDDADKAIEYGRRAVTTEPRFIWGHIALARGQMMKKELSEAELTLLGASRYGNFPTLEYELASVRAMTGFYREAAEGLARTFAVKDGEVYTRLGGRIERGNANITDLIGNERRASTFAPVAADNEANAAMMKSLLEFWQATESTTPDAAVASVAAERFTAAGDPANRVHRDLFAAGQLVAKNVAPETVIDLTKNAAANSETALDVPKPTLTVIADELYKPRSEAMLRGEILRVGDVPKQTLMSIVRGRIEELAGAALMQEGKTDDAVVRLKRSIGVLPADSAWMRSSYWRLGIALESQKKLSDALDAYIKGYKGGLVDGVKYAVIRSVYLRARGSLDGFEALAGPDPIPGRDTAVAENVTPTPEPSPSPIVEPTPEPTPSATPEAVVEQTPTPTPSPTPEAAVELTPKPLPTPTVESTPEPSPTTTSEVIAEQTPTPTPTPETTVTPEPSPSPTVDPTPEPSPASTPEITAVPTPTPTPDAKSLSTLSKTDIFPAVVITVPKAAVKPTATPTPTATPMGDATPPDNTTASKPDETPSGTRSRVVAEAPTPCKVTASEESLTLNAGAEVAVIIGTEDDRELDGLTATSSSPKDLDIHAVPVREASGRALFVVKSLTTAAGLYQLTFKLSCGSKELDVTVR